MSSSDIAVAVPMFSELASEPVKPKLAARRLDFIDGLRGFACLWVCFCHTEGYWCDSVRPAFSANLLDAVTSRVATIGGVGVDIFIVLSGFCLYWPLIQRSEQPEMVRTKQFYVRRFLRLMPVYYVALALCTLLASFPATQRLTVTRPITSTDVLTHLFLIQSLFPSMTASINGSFWSLALELQLYLCFPLVVLLVRRFGTMSVLVLAAVMCGLAWAIATTSYGTQIYYLFPARFVQFALGMVAAGTLRWSGQRGLFWLARSSLVLFPLAVAGSCFNAAPLVRDVLWGMAGASCIFTLAAIPERVFKSPQQLGWLVHVGGISYSIYLLQQPFLLLCAPLVKPYGAHPTLSFVIFGVLGLPILLGASWVLFCTVERPCMSLGKRWANSSRFMPRKVEAIV